MSKIKANAKKRDGDQARRMTTVDALRTLAAMLRRQGGETVLQAVQRLGKEMKEARAIATAVAHGRVASNGDVQGGGGAKGWRAKRARQKAAAAVGHDSDGLSLRSIFHTFSCLSEDDSHRAILLAADQGGRWR